MLQSSGVRSCERAISTKRASIATGESAGNQKGNKGVPEPALDRCLIAGVEFAERKKRGPECVFSVFESAELDYTSKEKKGDTSRCRRRIVKNPKKKD